MCFWLYVFLDNCIWKFIWNAFVYFNMSCIFRCFHPPTQMFSTCNHFGVVCVAGAALFGTDLRYLQMLAKLPAVEAHRCPKLLCLVFMGNSEAVKSGDGSVWVCCNSCLRESSAKNWALVPPRQVQLEVWRRSWERLQSNHWAATDNWLTVSDCKCSWFLPCEKKKQNQRSPNSGRIEDSDILLPWGDPFISSCWLCLHPYTALPGWLSSALME